MQYTDKQNTMKTNLFLKRLIFSALTGVSLTAASLLILSGCDLFTSKRAFPDAYYDSNFIEAIGFDQYIGDQPYVPPVPPAGEVSGSWDAAYRGVDWDGYNYITFVDTTDTAADFSAVPAGLDPTAPVYRLSLVNLISPNHFEAGIPGSWSGTGGRVNDFTTRLTGPGSLDLDVGVGQYVQYDEAAALDTAANYRWFFRLLRATGTPNVSGLGALTSDGWVSSTYTAVSPDFSLRLEPPAETFFSAWIDDLQLIKQGGIALRLRLRAADTSPSLEGGVYSFSIWVHSDPDSDPVGVAGLYPLNQFTMTLVSPDPENSAIKLAAVPVDYQPASGWRKLTATLASHALQFPTGNLPVLDLVIDLSASRSGSVLLAAPELRFHPDGL